MTETARGLPPAALFCDLCHDRRPADDACGVERQPALRPPRRAKLCAPCRDDRPGRRRAELIDEDFVWQTMTQRAADLADAYAAGRWLPYEEEHAWAFGLARAYWTPPMVEAALHDAGRYVRAGRLVRVVQPLPAVLAFVGYGDRALQPVRALIDTVASPTALP